MYAYIEEEMTVLSSHGNNLIYLGEKDKWQVEKIPVKTWRPWDESETLFYITKGQILSTFEKRSLMVSFYSLVSKWNWMSLKFSLSFNGIRTSSTWGKKTRSTKLWKIRLSLWFIYNNKLKIFICLFGPLFNIGKFL